MYLATFNMVVTLCMWTFFFTAGFAPCICQAGQYWKKFRDGKSYTEALILLPVAEKKAAVTPYFFIKY
jgi:hypothetical protein